VWRGSGAWSHAPRRSTAGASHEFDNSHEPYQINDSDDSDQEPYEFGGTYDHNEPSEQFCGSQQPAMTTALQIDHFL
jgi:hypothetical protein